MEAAACDFGDLTMATIAESVCSLPHNKRRLVPARKRPAQAPTGQCLTLLIRLRRHAGLSLWGNIHSLEFDLGLE